MSQKKYADFIIGIDEEGNEVIETCDSTAMYKTADVLVFFQREVLGKYYNSPQQYNIEHDGIISYHGWSLPLRSIQECYVAVALYEIGLNLEYEEQMYWKSYNVDPPDQFDEKSGSPMLDWKLKSQYVEFNKRWNEKFDWFLFKILEKGDQHYLKGLTVPLTENQSEFDHQILSIVKIFIDSLNEKKIGELLDGKESGMRGIALLEKFLELKEFPNIYEHTHFLKGLYWLRSSGVGHLKGESYKDVKLHFGLHKKSRTQVFKEILEKLIRFIEAMDLHFLR